MRLRSAEESAYLLFCPRKTPWFKPEVERGFRTLNDGVAHGVPGTAFRNILEKGDYNPEKFAVVSLTTFRWALRKWVADVYHQKEHRVLGMSPIAAWRSDPKSRAPRVPHDPAFIDAIVGRPDTRRLTQAGIWVNNLQYASPAIEQLRLLEGPELDVDISINDENLGKIWVMRGTQILEANALRQEYAEGITLWQHLKFREKQRKENLPDNPDGWLKAKEEIRQAFANEYVSKCAPRDRARHIDRGERSTPVVGNGSESAPPIPTTDEVITVDTSIPASINRKPFEGSLL